MDTVQSNCPINLLTLKKCFALNGFQSPKHSGVESNLESKKKKGKKILTRSIY